MSITHIDSIGEPHFIGLNLLKAKADDYKKFGEEALYDMDLSTLATLIKPTHPGMYDLLRKEQAKVDQPLETWASELSTEEAFRVARHGCEASPYMPAVTYSLANEIMFRHGDNVMEFLDDYGLSAELKHSSEFFNADSWTMMSARALITAVNLLSLTACECLKEAFDELSGGAYLLVTKAGEVTDVLNSLEDAKQAKLSDEEIFIISK